MTKLLRSQATLLRGSPGTTSGPAIPQWEPLIGYTTNQYIGNGDRIYKVTSDYISGTNIDDDIVANYLIEVAWGADSIDILQWSPITSYNENQYIGIGDKIYKAISNYTSGNTIDDDIDGGFIIEVAGGVDSIGILQWATAVDYRDNQYIGHSTFIYKTTTAYTSSASIEEDLASGNLVPIPFAAYLEPNEYNAVYSGDITEGHPAIMPIPFYINRKEDLLVVLNGQVMNPVDFIVTEYNIIFNANTIEKDDHILIKGLRNGSYINLHETIYANVTPTIPFDHTFTTTIDELSYILPDAPVNKESTLVFVDGVDLYPEDWELYGNNLVFHSGTISGDEELIHVKSLTSWNYIKQWNTPVGMETSPREFTTIIDSSMIVYDVPNISIGDDGLAGTVAYIDGQNIIEVHKHDIAAGIVWGDIDSSIVTLDDIGSGYSNTTAIVTGHTISTAAKLTNVFILDGYNDWYLPSIDELEQIYLNLHTAGIGNFYNDNYWSSSQNNIGTAKSIYFNDGTISNDSKEELFRVRPVRSFYNYLKCYIELDFVPTNKSGVVCILNGVVLHSDDFTLDAEWVILNEGIAVAGDEFTIKSMTSAVVLTEVQIDAVQSPIKLYHDQINGYIENILGDLYIDTVHPTEGIEGGCIRSRGKIFNAVWNDYADFWELKDGVVPIPGMCFADYGYGLEYPNIKADPAIMGIYSDTYGYGMGDRPGAIPIAVSGFVLAIVDKPYKPGTLLTNDCNGKLTKANILDILLKRTVAKYVKFEPADMFNKRVVVNGRHWVKV